MKKIYQLAVLIVVMAFSFSATAATKIAVVNIQQAVVSTERAKTLIKQLESEADYAESKAKVTTLQNDLEKIVEEAKRDGATWTLEQREAAGKKVANKKADLEHLVRKVQAQNKELVQQMMSRMAPDIQKALHDIVEKGGITLLLERQFVMHVDATLDVTPQLTAKLNGQ